MTTETTSSLPPAVDLEVRRTLDLLRKVLRRQGFTQITVQEALGWGRTYISQLLRRQKSLRYDQILTILEVIDYPSEEFFIELFELEDYFRSRPPRPPGEPPAPQPPPKPAKASRAPLREVGVRLRSLADPLVQTLVAKGLVGSEEYRTSLRVFVGRHAVVDPLLDLLIAKGLVSVVDYRRQLVEWLEGATVPGGRIQRLDRRSDRDPSSSC